MHERRPQSSKRSRPREDVTFTPLDRDRRSGRSSAPKISVSEERLPDGRRAVRVQGYAVDGIRPAQGESMVAIPKSVFLEAAAKIVTEDIMHFTKVARDIVTFTGPAARKLRNLRRGRAAK